MANTRFQTGYSFNIVGEALRSNTCNLEIATIYEQISRRTLIDQREIAGLISVCDSGLSTALGHPEQDSAWQTEFLHP
ncbi:MAG TPA: hypothetical protein VG675_04580 [Bryobacteraceae bacterium]|nr:hypothetical protein [Bryobacteraceae bacterium]